MEHDRQGTRLGTPTVVSLDDIFQQIALLWSFSSKSNLAVLCLLLVVCVVVACALWRGERRTRLSQLPDKPGTWDQKSEIGSQAASRVDLYGKLRERSSRKLAIMAVLFTFYCVFFLLVCPSLAISNLKSSESWDRQSKPTGLLDVFQVYQPVSVSADSTKCNDAVLLMEHVFWSSYGKPFVGNYQPPKCDFDTVRINFTVTSRGRQFDRLASMYLGDAEVFRTSTAEPTSDGIVWTYIKEMSQYNAIWKESQKLIFDLGNMITDTYTGSFNTTLTAYFSHNDSVKTADVILPLSARKAASDSSSAFSLPSDNATVLYSFPSGVSRAIVSISACGQSDEEFWWSNVFSSDTKAFSNGVGDLAGYSPFREVQLYIDGTLAGVVWPFPVVFTGGVAPGFWRPIVGIDAFDLRQPEIDISPFLPVLTDGQNHSFEIRVVGLDTSDDGKATLSKSVGSYWVVTGNIFLYLDDDASSTKLSSRKMPSIIAPTPDIQITRDLAKDKTGKNESLSYSVTAARTFSVSSPYFSWSQALSYSNFGFFDQQGFRQSNRQMTSGNSSSTQPGTNKEPELIHFEYPLLVNQTYGESKEEQTIDAVMKRGLNIEATGLAGISTYTLSSGSSHLHTEQWGNAHYESITGGSSLSSGDTSQRFESNAEGSSYSRSVRAVNGTVVSDSHSPDVSHPSFVSQNVHNLDGRSGVRSILGRGQGTL